MHFRLLLLGASLPVILAVPTQAGNEIAVREENKELSIAAREVLDKERYALIPREVVHEKTITAPSLLKHTSKFLVDSVIFSLQYLGGNKYFITLENAARTTWQAYITNNNLLGLDVMSNPVPALGSAKLEIIGVEPGDSLVLSYRIPPPY